MLFCLKFRMTTFTTPNKIVPKVVCSILKAELVDSSCWSIMSDWVKTVFRPDGTGYIDRQELQRLLEKLFKLSSGQDFKIQVQRPFYGEGIRTDWVAH